MSSILSTVGQLIGGIAGSTGSAGVDGVVGWVGDWLDLITSNSVLLLFCIALPLVGLGIGVIRRLTHIRA